MSNLEFKLKQVIFAKKISKIKNNVQQFSENLHNTELILKFAQFIELYIFNFENFQFLF